MTQEIRWIAAQWSLVGYPTPSRPWSPQRQLDEIRKAGFDGVAGHYESQLMKLAGKAGMTLVGGIDIGKKADIRPRLTAFRDIGVVHLNIQLCDHDTPTEKALPLALEVINVGRQLGLLPLIEVHRDTCTETPEKAYALADAFQKASGEPMPTNFDFSHPAIVKHLMPEHYFKRLVERRDLLAQSTMIHFRPFNGHHCQIPITNGAGKLSPEFVDWLPFCEAVLQVWKKSKQWGPYRVIVPEQGPKMGGYGLSCFPDIWQDVIVLTAEIRKVWQCVSKPSAPVRKRRS